MSLQREKREQFNYIFFGFFEENNFEITNIETKDIKFDLSSDRDNLELINTSLNLLPTDAWVLCQIIKVNTERTFIDIKILISGNFKINQDEFPKIMLVDKLKKSHLVWGYLTNIIVNANLFLNKKFKSEEIIGLAFISVKKLKEFNPKQNLLTFFPELLPQYLIVDILLSHLNEKELLNLRLTSNALRRVANSKLNVVFQNLPEDFDYTQGSIELYCNRFGKNTEDCTLCLDFNFKVKDSEYETPAIEWNRNLVDSKIKIQLKISCSTSCIITRKINDNTYRNQKLDIVHECISSLQNIVTLDIDFAGNWLIKDIGNKFLTSFSQSNITTLKISDVYLLWKPFLHSMKTLNLEELILTDVIVLDNLNSIGEDEDETYNPEEFNKEFIESLRGLKIFGIVGYSEFEDFNLESVLLTTRVLPLLKHLPILRSLQIENKSIHKQLNLDDIAVELSSLTELTFLNLSHIETNVYALLHILNNLTNITSLNLANTQLNGEKLSILIPRIRSLPHLTSLDVSNNMLSKRAIQNLTQQLKLTELNTANNVSDKPEEEQDLNEID